MSVSSNLSFSSFKALRGFVCKLEIVDGTHQNVDSVHYRVDFRTPAGGSLYASGWIDVRWRTVNCTLAGGLT